MHRLHDLRVLLDRLHRLITPALIITAVACSTIVSALVTGIVDILEHHWMNLLNQGIWLALGVWLLFYITGISKPVTPPASTPPTTPAP